MCGATRRFAVIGCVWALATTALPSGQGPGPASASPATPTLFLVGDSTVQTTTAGQLGWGTATAHFFDASRIRVVNRALGARSSRTFQTEGFWDQALKEMSPGDFVLIQFGHNDAGSLNTGRARGSLPGVGDETRDVRMEATELTTFDDASWADIRVPGNWELQGFGTPIYSNSR